MNQGSNKQGGAQGGDYQQYMDYQKYMNQGGDKKGGAQGGDYKSYMDYQKYMPGHSKSENSPLSLVSTSMTKPAVDPKNALQLSSADVGAQNMPPSFLAAALLIACVVSLLFARQFRQNLADMKRHAP